MLQKNYRNNQNFDINSKLLFLIIESIKLKYRKIMLRITYTSLTK